MFKDKNQRYINLFIDPPKWPYISKGSSPFSFCHWFLGIQPGSFFPPLWWPEAGSGDIEETGWCQWYGDGGAGGGPQLWVQWFQIWCSWSERHDMYTAPSIFQFGCSKEAKGMVEKGTPYHLWNAPFGRSRYIYVYTDIYIYATPPLPGDLLFRRCMRRKEQMRYTFCFVKKVRRWHWSRRTWYDLDAACNLALSRCHSLCSILSQQSRGKAPLVLMGRADRLHGYMRKNLFLEFSKNSVVCNLSASFVLNCSHYHLSIICFHVLIHSVHFLICSS